MVNVIPYKAYSKLLEAPYVLGTSDCFTVVREILNRAFGVVIPNYARPFRFHTPELNLMLRIAQEDFFIERPAVDLKDFQPGDILCFTVNSETVNHVGIYVGNNVFVHQLHNCSPREDDLSLNWMRRLKYVFYHQDVEQAKPKFDTLDLMPNYKKVMNYVE